MPRDHPAGSSHTSRRSWYIPASAALIALLIFLGGVAGNVVAPQLESLLKDFIWIVWGVFWVAMLVTVIMAIWNPSSKANDLAPDQHLSHGVIRGQLHTIEYSLERLEKSVSDIGDRLPDHFKQQFALMRNIQVDASEIECLRNEFIIAISESYNSNYLSPETIRLVILLQRVDQIFEKHLKVDQTLDEQLKDTPSVEEVQKTIERNTEISPERSEDSRNTCPPI